MQESKSPNKGLIALVVVVLLVAAGSAAVVMGSNKDTDKVSANTSSQSGAVATPSTGVSPNATFKDGTYTATANYNSPGGTQSITVKLTVSGGAVTDSSLTQQASAREDEQYEAQFESGYKSQVVGKKLSDINLSSVSGASLTTDGFNSALADIQKQAQT
jgi:uncharacterized protein with FMN-binding domain